MGTYECLERPGAGVTVVLLHPHPDMGGDRHHPVIDTLFRSLSVTTCRFDFSSSAVDVAQAQVVEAIERAPDGGVILAGYSFGADIALSVDHARLLGWFLIAPPLRVVDPAAMIAATDPRPKHLAVPEHDQFCPPALATARTAGWAATTLAPIAGSDHFLAGAAGAVLDALTGWLPAALDGA